MFGYIGIRNYWHPYEDEVSEKQRGENDAQKGERNDTGRDRRGV